MFGYVRPSDGHLTAEDKQRFQAAYCGLCRSLGRRYGLAARMILNYDLAFLAMLLSREPECPTAHCRCPAHPIRGCDALEPQPAFDTAADLSVILTWWQLTDGVADHGFFRGLPYRAALLALGRAYRKARARRPGFDERTRAHLEELARLEGERCPSMDRAADAFAALLAGAAEEEPDPVRRRVLEILLEEHRALGAYDVLQRLAGEGFGNQPPVAYRALDFLVEQGFAHRIQRLNAFAACSHPGADHQPAFLNCRTCAQVAEAAADAPLAALSETAAASGFTIERTSIEAIGLCPACKEQEAA